MSSTIFRYLAVFRLYCYSIVLTALDLIRLQLQLLSFNLIAIKIGETCNKLLFTRHVTRFDIYIYILYTSLFYSNEF